MKSYSHYTIRKKKSRVTLKSVKKAIKREREQRTSKTNRKQTARKYSRVIKMSTAITEEGMTLKARGDF
jgi:hypothetical protein